MNLYQEIYERFYNQFVGVNFGCESQDKCEPDRICRDKLFTFNHKITARKCVETNQVTEYQYVVKLQGSERVCIIARYRANALPFKPETERYYEPNWQDYTEEHKKAALAYLKAYMGMKIDDKDMSGMLISKDRFYISFRNEDLYNPGREHVLVFECFLDLSYVS